MTAMISVILNLIQNQLDSDFRQDDSYRDDSARQAYQTDNSIRQLTDQNYNSKLKSKKNNFKL